ncbi:MAG: BrnA antitoxin family protein [Gammaproteobacteria bacterium]|nr:BrnA antitoxin family protein [Gammaproteobacteria bacterium]MCP5421261.1 BrnA antitoxin family protein [Gammaproteobacteria bacterium]
MTVSKKSIKSNLDHLDTLRDEDIDYSDIPELDDAFFKNARIVVPTGKKQLTLRLDTDVLEWIKAQGKGYQSRINAILRAYYEAHRDENRNA